MKVAVTIGRFSASSSFRQRIISFVEIVDTVVSISLLCCAGHAYIALNKMGAGRHSREGLFERFGRGRLGDRLGVAVFRLTILFFLRYFFNRRCIVCLLFFDVRLGNYPENQSIKNSCMYANASGFLSIMLLYSMNESHILFRIASHRVSFFLMSKHSLSAACT